MYHWDLPQYIQDLGGWMNPIIVEYFERFADVLYENFGDRVKKWVTFNEPYVFCVHGYSAGSKAPLIKAAGTGEYLCGHYMLQSHAAAYKLYKDKYKVEQMGLVGICLVSDFFYPTKGTDPQVGDKALEFRLGWFAHPIWNPAGGYPKVMVDAIAKRSDGESRLPAMSDEMKASLIGSADFLALNYYSSRLVSPSTNKTSIGWEDDTEIDFTVDPSWKRAKSAFLYVVPDGLYNLLKWIKEQYR